MHIPAAVRTLERDLREIFGARLRSLVAYGRAAGGDRGPTPTLALVDALTGDDLRVCADRVAAWHDSDLATPLLLAEQEFARALDAFPYEFGAILSDHVVVHGVDPFKDLRVDPADLRRACEVQARSHLLHLREGYLETRGRGDEVADLLRRSANPLAALVKGVARLQEPAPSDPTSAAREVERRLDLPPGSLADVVAVGDRTLSADEARALFLRHLDAVQRLTAQVDRWTAHGR